MIKFVTEPPENRPFNDARYRRTSLGKPAEQDRKIGIFVSEVARRYTAA
jgi:hypothetical protein